MFRTCLFNLKFVSHLMADIGTRATTTKTTTIKG